MKDEVMWPDAENRLANMFQPQVPGAVGALVEQPYQQMSTHKEADPTQEFVLWRLSHVLCCLWCGNLVVKRVMLAS